MGISRCVLPMSLHHAADSILAHADFANSPVFLACDEPPIRPDVFLASFTNVLVDHTGTINVFAGWNESDVQLVSDTSFVRRSSDSIVAAKSRPRDASHARG